MTTNNINTNISDTPPITEGFSWHRVGQLYRYYSSVTHKQTLIYFIISAVCAVLTLLPVPEIIQTGFYTLTWTALSVIYSLAACAFGQQCASPIVERLLPARTSEKMTFFLTYLFIVMPLAVFALPTGALWLYGQIPSIQTKEMLFILEIKNSNPLIIQGFNILGTIVIVLVCLLVVLHARTNKIFKGVIAVIVCNIIISIFGAIEGITFAFKEGYKDGVAGTVPQDPESLAPKVIEAMSDSDYMTAMYIVLIVAGAVLIRQLYLTLSRRNL